MKPKLAFVSVWDAADPNKESGYAYSMRAQLQKRFEVIDIFPLPLPGERWMLPLRAGYKLRGQYYHPMREPAILKALGRRIDKELAAARPDVVFSPSSLPLSFSESRYPSVFATDQVFCDFIDTYIASPAARFCRLGHAQEARALARASRASFPSHWAASSAIKRYGADAAKIDVIPWGANLPQDIAQEDVEAAIARRPSGQCRLVFLGRDWQRKGGDLLVETVQQLNSRGLPTTATIIGCEPQGLPPETFKIYPFLDKKRPEHFAILSQILLDAHFFFLTSRAEAYGQAFCEAAAFGVPSIGSTAGGIPTIIRDGETGFVRPFETPASELAALIQETVADAAKYVRMARQAREEYRRRLNWNSFGERLSDAIMSAG